MTSYILHAGSIDATAMAEIHKRGFSHPWDENALRNLMRNKNSIVLAAFEDPQELVGFIMTRQAADEAEILTIATDTTKRRKGVAAHLMSHAMELLILRGCKRMFLEVASGNASALALYKKFGFQEVSRRQAYYKQGDRKVEDALVMSKDLGRL